MKKILARPILRELGHTFEVQPALQTPLGTKRPDYVFYRDEAARQALRGTTLTDEALRSGGIAVGDAKAWDRPLDVTARKGHADEVNANPSYQIAFYMQHSGLAWGMLTNGRLWRLYHKDSAHKLDRFYEVDLFALLDRADPHAFLYFYAFFRRAAFDAGPLGLETLLAASQEYARAVGNTLKDQVYDALLHMAQGFLDHPANGLQPDPATLKQIYDNSLIVLYRLLFMLYAEARDLLPLRESTAYRDDYSLNAIKRRVAQDREYGHALLPTSTRYWSQLRDLFGMIDRGSPPLKIAAFNGGLFDPQRHTFLERYSIGDARLQHAIDLLARVNKEFVDYRDLAERHLGTIYEGLLEYHLEALAPADSLTPVFDHPSPKLGEGPGVRAIKGEGPGVRAAFTIDLLNDKGERKATGSYYTPDYIVKYIVDQTVGPVLRRAVDGKTGDREIIRAVLEVNVLDPAMGSGHFLVEATDYIASFLVDLGVQPDEETGGEADVAFWKRRVAQSCIYGVDLNPLAVDLAKLSLWLTTVARDRPLSFLDHHLRCGNALVGARLESLTPGPSPNVGRGVARKRRGAGKRKPNAQPEAQLALFDEEALRQSMSRAVDSMWLIEGSAAHTVADVKEQEQAYQRVRADLNAKYGRLADLVTATHFGLAIDQTLWNPLADYATGRTIAAHQRIVDWLAEAERIAHERRFFHWELEFPEVFFDRHGQPLGDAAGFDAVVGNPPYIRQEELSQFKPFLAHAFPEIYNGVADLYVYFIGQGIRQLQQNGRFAYITSGTFRKLNFGAPLRTYLTSEATVTEIVEFGTQQVFSDAITYPIILIIEKQPSTPESTISIRELVSSNNFSEPLLAPAPTGSNTWVFNNASLQHILHGWGKSQQLGSLLSSAIYRGITTGLNEAFVIDQNTRDQLVQANPASTEMIKPFLRGEDLGRWYTEVGELWLILIPSGWTVSKFGHGLSIEEGWQQLQNLYPKIAAHLRPFEGAAKKRYDKGDFWWELRPCNYYPVFERPRINSTKVSLVPTFSLVKEPAYAANTSYVLPLLDETIGYYLLSVLNSKICGYYCRSVFTPKANGYYEVQPEPLTRFSVPRIAFTTPADERERLVAEARARYERGDHAAVLALVNEQLPRMPDGAPDAANERSDVVHDLLAFLAEQMIAMNKQRQDALEDFTIDLEGVLPAGMLAKLGRLWTPPRTGAAADEDAMRMLGPLAAGRIELRDDIGALNEEQWKWLIRRRVKKLDSLADVVRVFRRRQPPIAALDKRIAATDRLIDQIVYRLYNLTDDEIAIVEGRASER